MTVPTSKALSDLYSISFVDRGKPFSVDWNFIILPGTHRIDVASLNPASDHSPPGANPKGVLFVGSVTVEEGMTLVHLYIDETGGVYKRVRTVAGVWLPWDGLASKNHTHSASDLPSATTQARGVTILDTSVTSDAKDRASTPSATKQAYDRANEAYSLADQAFTQAVDLKNKIVGAINGKFGGASPDMNSDQIAAVITNASVKRFARGSFNGQSAGAPNYSSGATMSLSVNNMGFSPSRIFVRFKLKDNGNVLYLECFSTASVPQSDGTWALYGRFNNYISMYNLTKQPCGFTATVETSNIREYAGGSPIAYIEAHEWFAYE
ncbi:phage tail protein [Paenibacillus peoriae]|uniref:phage tail protein n=1 Tax=Paenibacillus peoriae TaxID=59893 RepID=UPI000B00F998|nr:phage tail protein [Paenibacillus peoriae]MCP3744367.1 tail fiber protein [Paenibacillus sp. A3M_27_13]